MALKRPLLVLAIWVAVIAALAIAGLSVESRLTQSVFILPGTETSRSFEIAADEFGENVIIPILLEGPADEIDKQGPALTATLAARDDTRVLSPWDRAAGVEELRPEPDAAMIVTTFDIPFEEAFDTLAPEVRAIVDDQVSAPVEARVSGMPIIGNDIKQETYDSADRAELIAMPILLIVLLLVFRAPIAALIPALVGVTTLFSSAGLIWLLAGWIDIDPIAVALASMMSLALGVDYSLLIISRFREELTLGTDPRAAVRLASGTAGRTVLFAATALIAAMLVALLVVPGSLLLSAAVGVIAATVLSVFAAFLAIPAALTLLGPRIDMFRIGTTRTSPRWLGVVTGAMRRPAFVTLAILIPLLALSLPALSLQTGPPDVEQLPENSRARVDYERIRDVMGPGWAAPFEVLVVGDQGTITQRDRLRKLGRFQRQLNRDPDVVNVVGPGPLLRLSDQASRAERGLDRGTRGLRRLRRGIRQARDGVGQIDGGLDEAALAAHLLAEGNAEAAGGADELSARLRTASSGTALLVSALDKAKGGSEQLTAGLERSLDAYRKLVPSIGFLKDKISLEAVSAAEQIANSLQVSVDNVSKLRGHTNQLTDDLQDAYDQLEAMTIGQTDPAYPALRAAVIAAYEQATNTDPATGDTVDPDYRGLDGELELIEISVNSEVGNAKRLAKASRRLAKGVGRIKQAVGRLRQGNVALLGGSEELTDALDQISGASGELESGLDQLAGGGDRLADGLLALRGGGDRLAGELSSAGVEVTPLISGLDRAVGGTRRLERGTQRSLGRTLDRSPRLFDSGYFVLAAVDGAKTDARDRASLAVNVNGGGEAARIVVVPRSAPNSEENAELRGRLTSGARDLERKLDVEAAVGGTASALVEYDEVTSSKLPLLIFALAFASYFVLIPIFRSILLPAIAVLLNLLSVAVSFAALAVLFQGDNPLLGGPGYVDAVSLSAIYTVVFGLSLDYQVFLITRMREGWIEHADTEMAIRHGLRHTAAVVTGAAAIMVAVFLAFAISEITNTRQFGIGLAIAVFVDATIVRLLLLPAVMGLFGDICWAMPRWLDRRLPRIDA